MGTSEKSLVELRVGQWLYASCSAQYYGEVVGLGQDANGQETVDIRVEDPNDLIWCEGGEAKDDPKSVEFWNPLTSLELPEGVKPVLRHVLYKLRGEDVIQCNTPGNGCFRCTKLFFVRETRE